MSPQVIDFAGNCGDTYHDSQWDTLVGAEEQQWLPLEHILCV